MIVIIILAPFLFVNNFFAFYTHLNLIFWIFCFVFLHGFLPRFPLSRAFVEAVFPPFLYYLQEIPVQIAFSRFPSFSVSLPPHSPLFRPSQKQFIKNKRHAFCLFLIRMNYEKQKQSGGKDEQFRLFVLFVLRKAPWIWITYLEPFGFLFSLRPDRWNRFLMWIRKFRC